MSPVKTANFERKRSSQSESKRQSANTTRNISTFKLNYSKSSQNKSEIKRKFNFKKLDKAKFLQMQNSAAQLLSPNQKLLGFLEKELDSRSTESRKKIDVFMRILQGRNMSYEFLKKNKCDKAHLYTPQSKKVTRRELNEFFPIKVDKKMPILQESKNILNHLYNYGINEHSTDHVHRKIIQSESQKFKISKADAGDEQINFKQKANAPKSYYEWINSNFNKRNVDNNQTKQQAITPVESHLYNILQNDPRTGELLNFIFEGFFNEVLNEHDKIQKRKDMVIDFLGD